MRQNYIVLRNSPDWLTFDAESSRDFCRRCRLPETLVIDFIDLWDRTFAVDYRHFRHAMKQIAMENLAAVERARIAQHDEFRARDVAPDTLLAFADDDDWMAPGMFARLGAEGEAQDGFKWGSARIGREFDESGAAGPVGLTLRPIDGVIYTNNYAVTAAAVSRLGFDELCWQEPAQQAFSAGLYSPRTVADYLSCTVRHPASTLSARFLLGSERFRQDPAGVIRVYAEGLERLVLPREFAWMGKPLIRLTALLVETLR